MWIIRDYIRWFFHSRVALLDWNSELCMERVWPKHKKRDDSSVGWPEIQNRLNYVIDLLDYPLYWWWDGGIRKSLALCYISYVVIRFYCFRID